MLVKQKKREQLLTRWFSPSSMSPVQPIAGGCGYLTIPVDPRSTPRAAARGSGSRSCCGPGRGCHRSEVIVSLQHSKNLEKRKHKLIETKYRQGMKNKKLTWAQTTIASSGPICVVCWRLGKCGSRNCGTGGGGKREVGGGVIESGGGGDER
jgi:hypothetical protein